MLLECEDCGKEENFKSFEVDWVEEGDKINEEGWFLDLKFESEDSNIVEEIFALCEDCTPEEYSSDLGFDH